MTQPCRARPDWNTLQSGEKLECIFTYERHRPFTCFFGVRLKTIQSDVFTLGTYATDASIYQLLSIGLTTINDSIALGGNRQLTDSASKFSMKNVTVLTETTYALTSVNTS